MILVVSDANIFIDLLKMGLIDHFFQMDFDIHTTDLVLAEVKEDNVDVLMNHIPGGKLNVRELNFYELVELSHMNEQFRGLSLEDCSCIWLCQTITASMLTSDRKLTMEAEGEGIVCIYSDKNK
jgi:hypothetical protein